MSNPLSQLEINHYFVIGRLEIERHQKKSGWQSVKLDPWWDPGLCVINEKKNFKDESPEWKNTKGKKPPTPRQRNLSLFWMRAWARWLALQNFYIFHVEPKIWTRSCRKIRVEWLPNSEIEWLDWIETVTWLESVNQIALLWKERLPYSDSSGMLSPG